MGMMRKELDRAGEIRLADGSLWFDPPDYVDGSGSSKIGNRRHVGDSPPSYDLLKHYGRDDLSQNSGSASPAQARTKWSSTFDTAPIQADASNSPNASARC